MKMFKIFGFVVLFTVSCSSAFLLCKLGDNTCLAKSIEEGLASLKDGSSEYGLRQLDPLKVDKYVIDSGKSAVQLVQNYDNVQQTGLSKARVDRARFNEKKKTLDIALLIPRLFQTSHYRTDGKILSLPIVGDGGATIEILDMETIIHIQLEETKRNSDTFFKIQKFDFSIKPKKLIMNFENLFNGNQLLGDSMNKLINDEWETLFNDIKPSLEKSFGKEFQKYAQEVFDKVPINKFFLK